METEKTMRTKTRYVAGTLLLLLAVTALALWMSGKIFRIGILRTGQPPKIFEMLRWATRRDR